MPIIKIQHPNLEELNITYGFFTRLGGVSQKPFDTLNCSFNNEDNKSDVEQNLELVRKELNLNKIVKLNQVHSSKVIIVNHQNENQNFKKADGLVTNIKGIGLSILGADCAPILLYDKVSNIIGACHAGWRGAIKNIIESTVAKMENVGSKRYDITAIIGPTIQKSSYEIKEDVAQIVKNTQFYKENNSILFYKDNNKYLFDLPLLLKQSLKYSKIKKIEDLKINTYTNSDFFFSHRRSSHESPTATTITGRQISVIGMLK